MVVLYATIRTMKYGNRLRVLRAERGITQLDIARKVRISQSRYWLIEKGYRPATKREQERIAKALRAEPSDAFGYEAVA